MALDLVLSMPLAAGNSSFQQLEAGLWRWSVTNGQRRGVEVLIASRQQPPELVRRIEADTNPHQQRDHLGEQRRWEYLLSRWLLRQLQVPADDAPEQATSISHSRELVAVACSMAGPVGLDTECRQPRQQRAVAERLGWPEDALENADRMRLYWTLWEAWRKSCGGSVLDTPDHTYRQLLQRAGELSPALTSIAGVRWASVRLADNRISLALRQN